MAKSITSTDPRKAAIVASLKIKSGCTKITNVVQVETNVFRGNCLERVGRSYVDHGTDFVTIFFTPEGEVISC